MKKFACLVILALGILVAYTGAIWAAQGDAAPAKPATPPAATASATKPAAAASSNVVNVTLNGTNYCLEKKLRGSADATQSVEACRNALKVDQAKDDKGKLIPELKGATVFYLYSAAAKPLWSDKANNDLLVIVKGTLYKNERMVDVKSFDPDFGEVPVGSASRRR